MNNLTRWDPFRELWDMRRTMDRLMEGSYPGSEVGQQSFGMPMDVCETQDAYEIEAALPGIKPEDVDVTLDQNTLTIRGETKVDDDQDDKNYHLRERRYGTFTRSITLPSNIQSDAINATYEDGILKLHLPKAEEARPKRIQIQGSREHQQIEGHSRDKK